MPYPPGLQCFSNNKPWITPDIKALLKGKKRAFRSGNKDELKNVQRELRRRIREEKKQLREDNGGSVAVEQCQRSLEGP